MKLIDILKCLLFVAVCVKSESGQTIIPDQDQDVEPIEFYNLFSNETLTPPITTILSSSSQKENDINNIVHVRFPFIGQPCSCKDTTCGCCAGMKIQQFNFDQKMCMNVTYDPYEFAIGLDMFMNERNFFSNSVSAKNPPPLCLPIVIPSPPPIPPLPIGLEMCAKLFNIFTPGKNLHMCMDIMARIQKAPVIILHFDCMRMGLDGTILLKPEDDGGLFGLNEGQEGNLMPPHYAGDIYDDVDEVKV